MSVLFETRRAFDVLLCRRLRTVAAASVVQLFLGCAKTPAPCVVQTIVASYASVLPRVPTSIYVVLALTSAVSSML